MQKSTAREQMYYASNCQVFIQPKGTKMLFVSNVGQYAEIFDIKAGKAVNKRIIVDNVPRYVIGSNGRLQEADNALQMGFIVKVTPSHIYMGPYRMTHGDLLKKREGNLPEEFEGPSKGMPFIDEIWVCDWEGNIQRKVRLNNGVSDFCVTHDDRTIWALSENEKYDTTIMKFSLGD